MAILSNEEKAETCDIISDSVKYGKRYNFIQSICGRLDLKGSDSI